VSTPLVRRGPRLSAKSSGSALARARVAAGLTQVELADAAGVTQFTVSNLEHGGKPLFETADRIARVLGRTVREFWPLLVDAIDAGRLLDTAIPLVQARRARGSSRHHGLRIAYSDPDGGVRVRHHHRPPICCGCMFCRVVDLNYPETYRVIGEPTLIAAGGVNA